MERTLELNIRESNGVTIIDLQGMVDRHTLHILEEAMEKIIGSGQAKILVNGEKLTYISSNGMGVFLTYLEQVQQKGGDIRFCNLQDVGKTVITVLGLHNLFQIFDSEEEALKSFQ